MDLYYPDPSQKDGFRRDVLRIHSESDAEAITEAERVNGWRNTSHYRIRSIRTSARSGDVVIFDSQGAEGKDQDAPAAAAPPAEGPAA